MVKSTTGKTEKVGAIRACQVEWEGRKGEMVERCVEAIPYQKIMWVMEQGEMKKMFSDIRFGFILEPKQSKSTLLRLDGYYQPRNAFTRLLYALMLRRKLHDMIQTLVGNLKDLIEKRAVASG